MDHPVKSFKLRLVPEELPPNASSTAQTKASLSDFLSVLDGCGSLTDFCAEHYLDRGAPRHGGRHDD